MLVNKVAIGMLVEVQWSPGSPGQNTPFSFWMEDTPLLSPPLYSFSKSLSYSQVSSCPGEDPGAKASAHASCLYSPMLRRIHLPGCLAWSVCWSPLRLHPWKIADRQKNHGDQRQGQRLRVPTGCWLPRVQSLRGPCRDC